MVVKGSREHVVPHLDVLDGGKGAKGATDILNPGPIMQPIGERVLPSGPARDQVEDNRGDLSNRLAIDPMIGPEFGRASVAKDPDRGGTEDGTDQGINRYG